MRFAIRGGKLVDPQQGIEDIADVVVEDGVIVGVGSDIGKKENNVIDVSGLVVVPGFVDLHAHLRDPGFEWKEDIESGCAAAVSGGITSVCCMANTNPVNDNPVVTRYVLDKAAQVGLCDVFPVGAITRGLKGKELADIAGMVKAGIVAISDDGEPVVDSGILRSAMEYAGSFGVPVFCHSEDKTLSRDGQVNEGRVSCKLGVVGIPPEAEGIGVFRDVMLAKLAGARVHICHVSTRETVELIGFAKSYMGVSLSCEVAPHHFSLTEDELLDFNTYAKVNPPLRSADDVLACREALKQGVVDVIATDHAPHTDDEKLVEFCKAPFGIIGFQTLLPLSLELVRSGFLTLSSMVEKLSLNPARVINKADIGSLKEGSRANVCVFDPEEEWVLSREEIRSKSRNTPFVGRKLKGRVKLTVYNGKIVFKDF